VTAAAWPTDHLIDVERRLERLWQTFRAGGDRVEMDDEVEAILFAVDDALTRAADAAGRLTPPASMESFTTLVERVGWLRDDLRRGIATADVIGDIGGYAARIEEAVEEIAAAWERAEWAAGRPRMTGQEAVADIAERLSWARPFGR